jgi:hypothetical protein
MTHVPMTIPSCGIPRAVSYRAGSEC